MIHISITELDFEHDLYALVRSFFPGEAAEAVVIPRAEGEPYRVICEAPGLIEPALSVVLPAIGDGGSGFSSRLELKSYVKREVYRALVKLTGKELPWGTLTGIRPAMLVRTKLDQGASDEEIRKWFSEEFYAAPDKTELCLSVAHNEREILSRIDSRNGWSLYIGIPFCPTRCLYCSFTSYPISRFEDRVDSYLDAVCREIDQVAEMMRDKTLQTIYIGGGTPTTLQPVQFERLFRKLEETFSIPDLLEFTVEAGRPDSITEEKLQVLREHGIERISVNPQTMQQKTLDLIGRKHTAEETIESFELARRLGFTNINMDLIMGLPAETIDDVTDTLQKIRALAPDSLTVHSLAVKRAARLNTMKDVYAKYPIINSNEMITLSQETALEMGLLPYYLYRQKNMAGNFENVGYASPGKACLYNILIMEEIETIVAVGAGAATKRIFEGGRLERCDNAKDVSTYMNHLDEMIERKRRLFSLT